MSINDINNAAAAMNQLKARYEGFLDDADDQIAQRQNAYDGLASDLKGVLDSEMYFVGDLEPDDPNPTRVNGGTFKTFRQIIDAAPYGAIVIINLKRDQVYDWAEDVTVYNKRLFFRSTGVGVDDAVINVNPVLLAGLNRIYRIICDFGTTVRFESVKIEMPTQKIDDAAPWASSSSGFIIGRPGAHLYITLENTFVSGAEELSLVLGRVGNVISFGLYGAQLDGLISLLGGATGCIAFVAKYTLTLSNGAVLNDGGVVGTTIFEN